MAELSAHELRELFAGTWLAMACVAEAMIQRGTIPRDSLLSLLRRVEMLARDQHRRSAATTVRRLIESEMGRDERFSHGWSLSEVVNQIFDEDEARAAQEAEARAEAEAFVHS